jgi:hypothetical protein
VHPHHGRVVRRTEFVEPDIAGEVLGQAFGRHAEFPGSAASRPIRQPRSTSRCLVRYAPIFSMAVPSLLVRTVGKFPGGIVKYLLRK